MTLQQAQVDWRDAQMREWKAKLQQLQARADQATAAVRADFHREMQELQRQFDALQARWQTVRESSSDGWHDVRSGFENAWEDFRAALSRVVSSFGGSPA